MTENPGFVPMLKVLVEETYNNSKNRKVALLGHSMGGTYSLYFLNKMSEEWRSQYIDSLILISVPLGGSFKLFKILVEGDNLDVPLLNPTNYRDLIKSFSSLHMMYPKSPPWKPSDVVMQFENSHNLTLQDAEQIYNLFGDTDEYVREPGQMYSPYGIYSIHFQ
ncbi:unnamed protein product [Protopolystoma xenopodis]|uniref:Uncharacterized protein n=1 Tax=Protopolystoma xenopodis TaxID=117903 RepID=A0A3S5AX55_9PLAT|nr:unnamed protein product [Protopolystoma xenopodis]